MGDTNPKALYRKYRGLSFDDIVGQTHITNVLVKAIKDDRISHGYLFTGPHGVGKTSVARVLAHAINGLEYKHEDNHIDIIEIDAASNRRIDEIRDLREKSHIAPVQAKYKVYIIDEVHMLTKEAFNALLKTLEEPPAHVVFILATTEAHKLPSTIISRTQRHTFKPITLEDAKQHLTHIAKAEKIAIDDEAIQLIAEQGSGSFRDAIGLLDQMRGADVDRISVVDVEQTLGLADTASISSLLEASLVGDTENILTKLAACVDSGVQPELVAQQLVGLIRSRDDYASLLGLADELLDVSSHIHPAMKLELILLKHGSNNGQPTPTVQKQAEEKPSAPATEASEAKKYQAPQPEPQPEPIKATPETTPSTGKSIDELSDEQWTEVVQAVKEQNNAIASILRAEKAEIRSDGVHVQVRFGFHKKKLEDKPVYTMIQRSMETVAGGAMPLHVHVKSEEKTPEKQAPEEENHDELADSIISTFGGGEKVNI